MSMPAVIQLLAFVTAGAFVIALVALIVVELRAQRSDRRRRDP
jgi:hypothetical protein